MRKSLIFIALFCFAVVVLNAQDWSGVKTVKVAWGSSDESYPMDVVPALKTGTTCRLTGWRGERVNAQALIWSGVAGDSLSVKVGEFRSGSHRLPVDAFMTGWLRYLLTDEFGRGCGRPADAKYDSSMVSDCIDHLSAHVALKAGNVQPLWVRCHIPQTAEAGTYKGNIQIFEGEKVVATLPMQITVTKRQLPLPHDWSFHLDFWQNPFAVARYNNVPLWSDAHFEAMHPVMKMLADAGQKVITASIMHHPWNAQTFDAFESMVTWVKRSDGTWYFDFAVFDRWVQFMMDLGIDRQINCYSMVPWKLSFLYFDQNSNRMQSMKAAPGDALYNEVWGEMLRQFSAHLTKKGWIDKTAIAMDERPMDVMLTTLKLIHKVAPDLKVSLAGKYHPQIEAYLQDYCLGVREHFPDSVLQRRKSEGKISTYYTCCSELHPNTFTFSSPGEAAWIAPYSAALGLNGYLRWSYNSWVEEPMTDSRNPSFPAGDTHIVYPYGQSSPRFEKMIEGIQAYEKIMILRDEYKREGKQGELKRLEKALSKFDFATFEQTFMTSIKDLQTLLNK